MGKAREAIGQAKGEIATHAAPLALGHCYEAVGDLDGAAKSFEAARKADPDNEFILRQVADFYLRNDKLAEAAPLIQRLIDARGKIGEENICWARRMMAQVLRSRGDFPSLNEAVRLINENLASSFATMDDQRVKTRLLLSDPRRAKSDEAIRMIENLIESEAVTADDRFQLAQLYLIRNEWSKYAAQMRSVLGSDQPKSEYVLFHVRALTRRNEISEADLWLGRLEKLLPNDIATTSLHADVLVRRKRPDEAMDLVTNFLDKPDAGAVGHAVGSVAAEGSGGPVPEESRRVVSRQRRRETGQGVGPGRLSRTPGTIPGVARTDRAGLAQFHSRGSEGRLRRDGRRGLGLRE